MPKYYTIRQGKKTWVFQWRDDTKLLVDGFPWAKYKAFPSKEAAQQALQSGREEYYQTKPKDQRKTQDLPYEKNSIAVDAACSGNPGELEYQGIDLQTGKHLFHQKFPLGTNNIWEFLALVHGLSYLYKEHSDKAIYSDSKHAIKRIQEGKCKTKLEKTPASESIYDIIHKAEQWLKNHPTTTKILKRNTRERGQIPADFGRK